MCIRNVFRIALVRRRMVKTVLIIIVMTIAVNNECSYKALGY